MSPRWAIEPLRDEHAVDAFDSGSATLDARTAGGKLIVVDALDESAWSFYEHHDFLAVPDSPDRLVMKLSTAATALGLAWP